MTDTVTVPKTLLIEAAEEVERMAEDVMFSACTKSGRWDSPEDQAEYERLSNLAERLRAAADRGDKAEITNLCVSPPYSIA